MVTFTPLPSQEWDITTCDIANLNEHIFTKIIFPNKNCKKVTLFCDPAMF